MIAYPLLLNHDGGLPGAVPSPGRRQVLVGLLLVASGLLLYRARHRQEAGEGVVEGLAKAFEDLERPLARAMRTARRMI